MRQNIKYIILGLFAFIFATTASSVVGTLVNALIPNPNKPDPAGKLDPDPQQKSKAEWLQQLEGGGPRENGEAKTETQEQNQPAQETVTRPEPAQASAPQQVSPPPAPAPAPTVGPGDFDAPAPYSPPPAPRTGPGNM